jgi:hypothetical protein
LALVFPGESNRGTGRVRLGDRIPAPSLLHDLNLTLRHVLGSIVHHHAREKTCHDMTGRGGSASWPARLDCVVLGDRGIPCAAASRATAVGAIPAWQQQTAPPQGRLHGRGGHRVAVGAHQRRDLRCPTPATPRRTSPRSVPTVPPSAPATTMRWIPVAEPGEPPPVGTFGNAGQSSEPRNRQSLCRSQAFEVTEGT